MTVVDPHLQLDDGVDGGAQLEQILPGLGALIAQVGPAEMRLATPCEGWTTRDLLNHVIGGAEMFAASFAGAPLRDISGRLSDVVGDDPSTAFGRAVDQFGAAVQEPGAMEQVLALPVGSMTGQTFLRFAAFDLLIHSWDLATTLDAPLDLPDELVAEVDHFAHVVLDPWTRDRINFQEPATAQREATAIERLVAFTGRSPAGIQP
ncbi:MAG: TIGR03086 family protein [Acidimicrobiia bacterium]|nr:TIGR03086 family protein [Acidimicrobiia bacterium]